MMLSRLILYDPRMELFFPSFEKDMTTFLTDKVSYFNEFSLVIFITLPTLYRFILFGAATCCACLQPENSKERIITPYKHQMKCLPEHIKLVFFCFNVSLFSNFPFQNFRIIPHFKRFFPLRNSIILLIEVKQDVTIMFDYNGTVFS